jgi:AraC family transcriptional regulator of adaptative response/methylated-DNA-[protein]-cysteine methyltransferase
MWAIISRRDRRFDGRFVYVALTTNIYCRPSCPARLPQRARVRVLASAEDAERGGYSACRRCYPRSLTLAPTEKGIHLAIEFIQRHVDEPITLRSLAGACGLSPHHLQRVFSRIVGVSPREFCDFHRLERLRSLLRAGNSVSTAAYEAGYGSLRAVYERAGRGLGMTPAAYKRGGEGVGIGYATTKVELGNVLIAGSSSGICMLALDRSEGRLPRGLEQEFPAASCSKLKSMPFEWMRAVLQAEREDPLIARLDWHARESVFRANVWTTLARPAPRSDAQGKTALAPRPALD